MPATEAEIRALYGRYAPVLLARCRRILGDDEEARDVVQDTFARVIRHHDSFRAEASPFTWMVRISTNLCLNRLRDHRGRTQKAEQHRELLVGEGFTRPDAGRGAEAERVRRLLEEEDDETRALIVYLYFDDMTRQEAAALVGISQPTLRKRVDRFFERARRSLGADAAVLAPLLFHVLVRP